MTMKKITVNRLLILTLVGGASPIAWASTPYSTAVPPGPERKSMEFQALFLDRDSERYGRYYGPADKRMQYGFGADLLFKGGEENKEEDNRYSQFLMRGLGTDSPYFKARQGEQGNYSIALEYRERPKYQYLDLGSPLIGNDLHLPQLGAGQNLSDFEENWDIKHKRESFRVSGQKVLNRQWRMGVTVNREDKAGHRLQGYGQWFNRSGFQMPAPIDQRTDQISLDLQYAEKNLQGRMGYHVSRFQQLGNNYFLAQDPTSASLSNPNTHHLSLAPDNNFHQIFGSLAYAFSDKTRMSTEFDYGRARQDKTYVHDPNYADVLTALGDDSLNAKLDTMRFAIRGNHRFNDRTRFRIGYRLDDRNTRTTMHRNLRSEFNNLRTMRPIDMRRQTFNADANIRVMKRSTLQVGGKHEQTDRDYADRNRTEESTVYGRFRSSLTNSLSTGVKASYGERTGSTYDDTVTNNNQALRKYHLASVDRTRLEGNVNWSAMQQLALGAEVTWREDDYDKSELGLQDDDRVAVTLTADFFPSDRYSGYSFFTHEQGKRKQAGRNEFLKHKLTTYTLGVGGKGKIDKDGKWNLGSDFLLVDNTTDIDARNGNDYTSLKSKLHEFRLYGDWQPKESTTIKLMYILQHYEEQDWALGYKVINQGTSGDYWLMGADEYDKTVNVVMGSLKYNF